jgi:hypothetical protein
VNNKCFCPKHEYTMKFIGEYFLSLLWFRDINLSVCLYMWLGRKIVLQFCWVAEGTFFFEGEGMHRADLSSGKRILLAESEGTY